MDATDTSSGDSSTQQHDDGGGTATEAAPQLDENTVEAEDDDGTATELQRLRAAASSPLLDLPTRETIRMVDKPKRRGATRGVAALKAARQGSDDTGTPAVASASDTVDMDLIQRRCEESVRRAAYVCCQPTPCGAQAATRASLLTLCLLACDTHCRQHTALMKEMRAKRKAQRKATQGRRRWSLVRKAALVAMAMSRVGKDVVEGSADVSLFPALAIEHSALPALTKTCCVAPSALLLTRLNTSPSTMTSSATSASLQRRATSGYVKAGGQSTCDTALTPNFDHAELP